VLQLELAGLDLAVHADDAPGPRGGPDDETNVHEHQEASGTGPLVVGRFLVVRVS